MVGARARPTLHDLLAHIAPADRGVETTTSHDAEDLAILSLRIDHDESEIDITATPGTGWIASEKKLKRRMSLYARTSVDPLGRIARTRL